ncbi:MAG: polyprenyl synthetase family protein [Bacteroidaceae bacterium]|nr:polyprenyl synthetase family protein [Bacteroidaceae bacterium]
MADLSTIKEPIQSEFEEFKRHYSSVFVSTDPLTQQILDYVKSSNGKMMRPILVLLIAKSIGIVNERVFNVAASFELLHSGSLIHDDVVDESNLRRGNPSVNCVFDNKLAVLSGDYVISLALQQMSLSGNIANVGILSELSKQLSEGEIMQLESISDASISEETYFEVITRKTASLFSYAAKAAALTAGADAKTIAAFQEYGRIAGLCFQIRDDIFDYFKSDQIGKPTANDLHEGKLTLPAIYSLTHSESDWTEVISSIKNGTATDAQIKSVIDYTISSGGIDYAYATMEKLKRQAIEALPSDIPADLMQALIDYISVIVSRKS